MLYKIIIILLDLIFINLKYNQNYLHIINIYLLNLL